MYFFAKTLNLPEEVTKRELSRARKFCHEAGSDSDESAWANELDDSSDISGSNFSTATSSANLNGNEAMLKPFQSLPSLGQLLAGDKTLGLGSNGLETGLFSVPSGKQSSLPKKVSKKRKLDESDVDGHEAKQRVSKRVKARRAKEAKLQDSNTRGLGQVISSPSVGPATEKPTSEVENESPKPFIRKDSKRHKRRKKAAKTSPPMEVAEVKDVNSIEGIDKPPSYDGTGKDINRKAPKTSKKAKPEPETSSKKLGSNMDNKTLSKKPAADLDQETTSKLYQDIQRNGTRQPQATGPTFKSLRKAAKIARRRAAKQANMAKKEGQPKSSESESAPDKGNRTAATRSDSQQDSHSPQDFHSPMIQLA